MYLHINNECTVPKINVIPKVKVKMTLLRYAKLTYIYIYIFTYKYTVHILL